MNDLNVLSKQSKKQNKSNSPPPMSKCMYFGCPMSAGIIGGSHPCTFHDTSDYHQHVTQSIKNNVKFIKWYNKMVHWNSQGWEENNGWLMTNLAFPMEENEVRTLYINRFFQWLSHKIADEATELVHEMGQAR